MDRIFKSQYDEESDSLVVYREDRHNQASISFGEIVVDLDKNMNISAIEILNPDMLYGISKDKLARISEVSVRIQRRGQVFWIFMVLKFAGNEPEERIQVPLQLEKPISV